jgi:ribosomal subunit interface protein
VVLDAGKKGRLFAEITMGTRGKTLVGKANAENMGKAIDDALLKIERQLKKQNQRKHEYRQNNSRTRIEPAEEEKEEVEL